MHATCIFLPFPSKMEPGSTALEVQKEEERISRCIWGIVRNEHILEKAGIFRKWTEIFCPGLFSVSEKAS